ncbi:MAG: response regulator transcription factor [Lachnospiraceae bacterium]|nr:response regulator transcription factor [Lachnospiraceae bacterium]
MINIAFCDDDISVLEELQGLIRQYEEEHERKIACASYSSPLELMAAIEKGIRFDILFLDIIMPGENGMDVAAEIRRVDDNVKIVFLTSSSEYAVRSYTVGAFYYQLKPIKKADFERLLDSVLWTWDRERTNSIVLRSKNGITRIELKHLEYCEVIHRTLFIHMDNGKVLECIGNLDGLCKELDVYGGFLRPHRSFLVNLDYITNISYRAITMSCQVEIPIPRGKYHDVKDVFLEHAFKNRQVLV